MSIENLKKILESEREDLQSLFAQFDSDRKVEFIEKYPMLWSDVFDIMEESRYHRAMINSVLAGHNSATIRLLPLLQKAVEILNEINIDNPSFEDSRLEWMEIQIDKTTVDGIREFLSEFTKMTDIKKEGL